MTKEVNRVLEGFVFISSPQNAKEERMGNELLASNNHFSDCVGGIRELINIDPLDHKLGFSPVVFSIATHHALVRTLGFYPEVLAGFSVGENASLVQGGAIELSSMMQVLMERENLTGAGRPEAEKRHMIAFRGISLEGDGQQALRSFLDKHEELRELELTNIIGSSAGVLSGEVEDYKIATQKLRELSGGQLSEGRKVIAAKLDMPDAFHSSWMRGQEIALKTELERLNIRGQVRLPQLGRVYSPMLQRWLNTESDVYLSIAEQLTRPVDIRIFCEMIRGKKFVVSADPTGITPGILERNGVENVFNISDVASFESVVEMLWAAA